MGTRGAVGFRLHETDRMTYNHFDSYPDGLGADVIKDFNAFVAKNGGYDNAIGLLKQMVLSMEEVDRKVPPTDAQKKFLAEYANISVSNQTTDDWYCMLREAQGRIVEIAKARYFENANDFMLDGLFCEYAYVINLDTEMLEFYKGFEKKNFVGRYGDMLREGKATLGSYGYGPVTLLKEYPLNVLSDDTCEDMQKIAYPEDEDDEDEE